MFHYVFLGLWKHLLCVAHTLNLAVTQAIDGTLLLPLFLKKCRAIVTYFHSSQLAVQALIKHCSTDTLLAGRQLQQEVATRWNSTFIMLRSLSELKTAILSSLGELQKPNLMLSPEEWEFLDELLSVLGPCEKVTKVTLSSQKYPSVSRVKSNDSYLF